MIAFTAGSSRITDPQLHGSVGDETRHAPTSTEPGAAKLAALRAQIEPRFGYLPAFFESAFACPDTLANLWHSTRHAYLENPLPEAFKELTLLLSLRRAGAGLVEHALALTRRGLAPRDAAWLYSWAPPLMPPGWTAIQPTAQDPGLRVRIR